MEGRSSSRVKVEEVKTGSKEVAFLPSINHHWLQSQFQRSWQFLLIKLDQCNGSLPCRWLFFSIPVFRFRFTLDEMRFTLAIVQLLFPLLVSGWRLHFIEQESCKLIVIYWSLYGIDIYHRFLLFNRVTSSDCHIFKECTMLVPSLLVPLLLSFHHNFWTTSSVRNGSDKILGKGPQEILLKDYRNQGRCVESRVCVLSIHGVIISSVMSLICRKFPSTASFLPFHINVPLLLLLVLVAKTYI